MAFSAEIFPVTRPGKIFGAMPMVAKLKPEEARAPLKQLDARAGAALTMLFRKSK